MTALPDIPRLYTALAECLAVLLFTPALAPRFPERSPGVSPCCGRRCCRPFWG